MWVCVCYMANLSVTVSVLGSEAGSLRTVASIEVLPEIQLKRSL